jgi:5-formyltetrahydrofolate cyclo-ligase
MKTKAQLREWALNNRMALSETAYRRLNDSLCSQLIAYIESENIRCVHFFLPILKNREPDFRSLFPRLWSDGRSILVSKTHFKSKALTHYFLHPDTELQENSWGIPEPVNGQETSIEKAELIVVPLLLADGSGHRLGYGGGFYDKLLKDFHGKNVGVSLLPVIDKLPIHSWDVPLQKIFYA